MMQYRSGINGLNRGVAALSDGQILKEYIDWYLNDQSIGKEELYKSYYGKDSYQYYMTKKTLEKYLG